VITSFARQHLGNSAGICLAIAIIALMLLLLVSLTKK
jgi:hypothetical protein